MTSRIIGQVGHEDLAELLPMLRQHCDFYRVAPTDADLLCFCPALIADPDREGLQLIARDKEVQAVGFATIYWMWSTTMPVASAL